MDDLLAVATDPEVRRESEELASRARQAERRFPMTLGELRNAFALTQVALAKRMGCSQARISEAEHRPDMLVSTLTGFLSGLGLHPRMVVDVPGEGEVRVELEALMGSGD